MINVTISIPEDILARLRVKAAQDNLSVSRFIGRVLQEQLGDADAYREAMNRFFANDFELQIEPGERYLTRDEAHDRAGLRRR